MDPLVTRGDITGAGISLDASKRELNTGLIDMQEFVAGTSLKDQKLC